jgi:hemerythrin superfamily protein
MSSTPSLAGLGDGTERDFDHVGRIPGNLPGDHRKPRLAAVPGGYRRAMDVLDLLTADHDRMRGLFARIKKARQAGDTPAWVDLGNSLFRELRVHAQVEEEVFYAWVRSLSEEIGADVEEGLQEHHEVDILMEEASSLDPTSPQWQAKAKVIVENTEHHIGEEEEDLFPAVRSVTAAEDRQRIGRQLESRKAELGAPTLAATVDLTTTELRRLASEQEIPGRSKMDHDQLAAAVTPR